MNRCWTLTDAPLGALPDERIFALREAPTPSPGPGQMLTRTIYLSLDPYQWMYKRTGREGPGDVCHGRTVSQVVESRMDGYAPGDFVFNTNGWCDYGLSGEGVPHVYYMGPRKIDPALGPISFNLGVLGMPGLTAYAGMVLQCQPRAGETAVVSAASGGVGQIAGQLAKLRGCRVVGIAGKDEKCRFVVDELGFDACVSHLSPTLADDLAAACPDGVDVYFENVGGPVFEAVAGQLNRGARVSICGVISQYTDGTETDAKGALKRKGEAIFGDRQVQMFDLMVGGFVKDHEAGFLADMARWVRAGQVKYREDIWPGLEQAPRAFAELMRGGNFGKILVQVGADPTAASQEP